MGWTSTHKPNYLTTIEYFRNILTSDNHEVLDIAFVQRSEIYAAVKIHSTQEVVAFVAMVTFGKGYYNLSYKNMDESMGPAINNCPERILKLLSPTDCDSALKWRKQCMDRIKKRKSNPKLQRGMVIRFKNEILFRHGSELNTFIVLNPRSSIFSDARYIRSLYRITNFRDREFEVVGQCLNLDKLPRY